MRSISFDQGTWDAVEATRNQQRQDKAAADAQYEAILVALEEIGQRINALEKRFVRLKKGVWSA